MQRNHHDLKVNEDFTIKNVTSTENTPGQENIGYNGTFKVVSTPDSKTFTFDDVMFLELTHFLEQLHLIIMIQNKSNPRFSRNDVQEKLLYLSCRK